MTLRYFSFTKEEIGNIREILTNRNGKEEVEWRIQMSERLDNKISFVPYVLYSDFSRLKKNLEKDLKPTIEKSKVEIYDDIRKITVLGKPPIYQRKTKSSKPVDLNYNFINIRLSRSEETELKEVKSLGSLKLTRNRERYNYTLINGNIISLTEVETNGVKTYEIELELTNKTTLSLDDSFNEAINSLAYLMYRLFPTLFYLPRDNIVRKAVYLYNKGDKNIGSFKSLFNKLVPLKLDNIRNMKDYPVSNKLDGSRYFFYVDKREGEILFYLVNPMGIYTSKYGTVNINNILILYPTVKVPDEYVGTLVDGELFQKKFYLFDSLFVKGNDVRNLNIKERIKMGEDMIKYSENKSGFQITPKRFLYSEPSESLYKRTLQTLIYMNSTFKNRLIEDNDGLVYPNPQDYSSREQFKLKFNSRITMDLKLKLEKELTSKESKVYSMYTLAGNKNESKEVRFSPVENSFVTISSSNSLFQQNLDGYIGEIKYSSNKFILTNLRTNKLTPNPLWIIEQLWEEITNPVLLIEYLDEMKKMSGPVDAKIESLGKKIAERIDLGIKKRPARKESDFKKETKQKSETKTNDYSYVEGTLKSEISNEKVIDLIRKRTGIDVSDGKMGRLKDDKEIYSELRKIYTTLPSQDKKTVQNIRSKAKVKELKNLFSDVKYKHVPLPLWRGPGFPGAEVSERLATYIPKGKYLDFGAGDSIISGNIGNYFKLDTYATDISNWHSQEHKADVGVKFEYIKNDKIPFGNVKFDLITSMMVLHHIDPKKLNNVIRDIVDRLEDNGILVVREHDLNSNETKKLIDIEHAIYDNVIDKDPMFFETYIGNYKSIGDWINLLKENGLEFLYKSDIKGDTRNGYIVFKKVSKGRSPGEIKEENKGPNSDCFYNLRKYHNSVKRKQISSIINKTGSRVLDLGSGYGGDLDKYWSTENVNKLYLLEPDSKKIEELKNRIKGIEERYQLTPERNVILNLKAQDFKEIVERVGQPTRYITTFFSMTFMFGSKEDLELLARLLDRLLMEDGYFFGTVIDGYKIRKLLKDKDRFEMTENGRYCGEIIRMYDSKKEPGLGDKIKIKLAGMKSIEEQEEYLVYLDILEKEMGKYFRFNKCSDKKLEFKSQRNFNKSESIYTELNVPFCYHRLEQDLSLRSLNEDVIEAIEVKNSSGHQFARVGVVGDGSCFFHGFLYSTSYEYRNSSKGQRTKMVVKLREGLANDLTLNEFIKYFGGATRVEYDMLLEEILSENELKLEDYLSKKENLLEYINDVEGKIEGKNPEIIKEIKKLNSKAVDKLHNEYKSKLKNCGSWVYYQMISYLMYKLKINIIIIKDKNRLPVSLEYNENNPYIFMLNVGDSHYEALGVVYSREGKYVLQYVFSGEEEVVKKILNIIPSEGKESKSQVTGGHFDNVVVEAAKALGVLDIVNYPEILTYEKVSRYSSLMPWHIRSQNAAIKKHVGEAKSILDGTAHIGVDTLNLHSLFPRANITSVEMNKDVCELLKKNVVSYKNSKVVCDDLLNFLGSDKGTYDLVYLDPPWGGVDYKEKKQMNLELSGVDIKDIIKRIKDKYNPNWIILKAPLNYDYGNVQGIIKSGIRNESGKDNYTKVSYNLYFIPGSN